MLYTNLDRSLRCKRGVFAVAAVATTLSLFGLNATSFAQEPAPVTVADVTVQSRLDEVHKMLAVLEKGADDELKESLPTITVSLERWAMTPEETTATDLDLYKCVKQACFVLTHGNRDFDPLGMKKATNPVKEKITSVAAVKPVIAASERRIPGRAKAGTSGRMGVVTIAIGGVEKTIAEVPNAAGGMSAAQRAQKIAQRIQAAAKSDPMWYLGARRGQVRGDSVVLVDRAPGGYILTADPDFARLRQLPPDKLAAQLAMAIRNTVDKPSILAKGRALNPDDRQASAVECRVKGDAAYDKGNTAEAEKQYLAGLQENSAYAVLYDRLANLYDEQNKTTERDAMVKKGLALPNLDESVRHSLSALK